MRKASLFVLAILPLSLLCAMSAQAASRLDKIKAAGVIRVCIWPEYYSITYRNTRTGALEGIDVDMAHAFASDLGVRLDFVESSFKSLVADLEADRCDVSMHGIGVTPARQEKLDFTAPTLRSGIYAITSRSNPAVAQWRDLDTPGIIVAAQAGTYMVDVMRARLTQASLVVVATPEAREQDVMSGRADAFVTDYPYSRKMLARHDWAVLLTPPQPLAPTFYAYAVAKGDAVWREEVNAFVARAKKDGRLKQAAERNGLTEIVVLD